MRVKCRRRDGELARRLSRRLRRRAGRCGRTRLGSELKGFTYPDRPLNIEVAYDFRQHGYTERNYISDPEEWSNLFHWKGPPDRWRVPFPTAPAADATTLV